MITPISCSQYHGCCQALEGAFGACQFAGTQYETQKCAKVGKDFAHFLKVKKGTSPRVVANRSSGGGGPYPSPSHKKAAFLRACSATFLLCRSCHLHYDRRVKTKVKPRGTLRVHLGFDGGFRLVDRDGAVVSGEPCSPSELAESGVLVGMSYFQLRNTAFSEFFSLG